MACHGVSRDTFNDSKKEVKFVFIAMSSWRIWAKRTIPSGDFSDLEQFRKYTWKTVNPVFEARELLLKSDFQIQEVRNSRIFRYKIFWKVFKSPLRSSQNNHFLLIQYYSSWVNILLSSKVLFLPPMASSNWNFFFRTLLKNENCFCFQNYSGLFFFAFVFAQ